MNGKSILYYPQLSMYDKQTKELLPQADGNVNMMRNTILEWQKYRPNDKFYILLPRGVYHKLSAILPDGTPNCYPIFYDGFVVSARINRFNFPMQSFTYLLKTHFEMFSKVKIDLIINDVIELTGNFKQMFKIEFGYTPKIISNIRHVDDNTNYTYIYRVIDGIEQSDLVTILSDSMKSKLDEQIINLVHYSSYNEITNKIITFEPSISEKEFLPYTRSAKINDGKIRITFPGRLAKGEERRTNWDKFIEAIQILRNKRQDFEVYLTDPNNGADWNIGGELKTIPKDRNIFLNLLSQTDIIVSLMDVEGFGGISIREALLFNCRPVIPYVHEYKKMMDDETYEGYVKSPIEVNDLVRALNWAIDEELKNKQNYFYVYGKQFTVEEQFKKLLPKLEGIING